MTNRALQELAATRLDSRFKGVPLGADVALADVAGQRWNVARGDLALPVTTLRQGALENNLEAMAEYCRLHGALLAPHGKTTMAPQLFHRQLGAGAWGITAATPTQAALMRRFGVPRIVLANELSESASIRWIASELEGDANFHFSCLVDDVATVALMDAALEGVLTSRQLEVMIEVGFVGGRGGVRTHETALEVARAVKASRHLSLVGVETFEGLVTDGVAPSDLKEVNDLCHDVRTVVLAIAREGLFGTSPVIVTAGGSAYFDRIVEELGEWPEEEIDAQLVLRSGCYLTHDTGHYSESSPLDQRRAEDESLRLINALEAWAVVLSRPEPGLAILGAGKRDLPFDVSMPTPLRRYPRDGSPAVSLEGRTEVTKLMDQHAFVTLPEDLALEAGDVVALGVAHPCTAFDKMRLLPIIDDELFVVDAVLTFF